MFLSSKKHHFRDSHFLLTFWNILFTKCTQNVDHFFHKRSLFSQNVSIPCSNCAKRHAYAVDIMVLRTIITKPPCFYLLHFYEIEVFQKHQKQKKDFLHYYYLLSIPFFLISKQAVFYFYYNFVYEIIINLRKRDKRN